MEKRIDITGVDLRTLIKSAYAHSQPQGLGMLHYEPGELEDEMVDLILERGNDRRPVDLDYVKGRSLKFTVFKENDRLYVRSYWYDHSPSQLKSVLQDAGVDTTCFDPAIFEVAM